MNEADEYCCRICFDEGHRENFIAPCKCSGTSKWVHRQCLDKWRSTREDKAFTKCTECLQPYKLICPNEDGTSCSTKFCFYGLVFRDLLIAVIFTQVAILLFGYIIFSIDKHNKVLLNSFDMQAHPKIFYYSFSTISMLAVIGVFFTCSRIECCARNMSSTCNCLSATPCDCCYCYSYQNPVMFWYYGDLAAAPDVCCCGCPACECGTCETCEMGSAGASLGHEAFVFLMIAIVVFAIIGVFVCIIAGTVFMQFLVRRHIHVLRKLSMTREYMVADLAPGAIPILGMNEPAAESLESGLGNEESVESKNDNSAYRGSTVLEMESFGEIRRRGPDRGEYHEVNASAAGAEFEESYTDASSAGRMLGPRQVEELRSLGLL